MDFFGPSCPLTGQGPYVYGGGGSVGPIHAANRLLTRTAFGKRLAGQSVWEERITRARIDIEMSRLLCLEAADMMDRAAVFAAPEYMSKKQGEMP